MGFEHQVELADAGEIFLAAFRAYDVVPGNKGFILFVGPAVGLNFFPVGFGVILDQLIGAKTGVTFPAVHQRIVEGPDVTGSDPHLRVHQNRAVQTDVEFVFLYEFFPPGFLTLFLNSTPRGP